MLTLIVLVNKCHVSSAAHARGGANLQCKSRWRSVSDILLSRGEIRIRICSTSLVDHIKGISTGGSSMPYSVTKAAGLQLMKCLASTQGPKIRVNAILPGLLLTEWGLKYGEKKIEQLKAQTALKQETLLDDCADAYISAAKNSSMTGQQIVIDSGLVIR